MLKTLYSNEHNCIKKVENENVKLKISTIMIVLFNEFTLKKRDEKEKEEEEELVN